MHAAFAKGFVFSTLMGLIGLAATQAGATTGTSSYSATACVNSELNGSYSHTLDNGQVVNRLPSNSLTDYCPVVNDGVSARAPLATNIQLHGWSTFANSIIISACRTSTSGGYGTCGGTAYSTVSNGVDHLAVAPGTAWTSGGIGDGYYILVTYAPNAAIFSYGFAHS